MKTTAYLSILIQKKIVSLRCSKDVTHLFQRTLAFIIGNVLRFCLERIKLGTREKVVKLEWCGECHPFQV